jgi:hypothetical protein
MLSISPACLCGAFYLIKIQYFMDKNIPILINQVSHFLKAIAKNKSMPFNNGTGLDTKVEYKFSEDKAYIYIKADNTRTGNGFERYYDWNIIDNLKDVSDKYGINYKIGLNDALELNVQVYVL